MRIVIDMQGAQTGSRFRGIGRYTTALAQAMVRHCGDHEVILLLNGMFPETILPIREAFQGLLPKSHILVWNAQGPVCTDDPENTTRRHIAEAIREDFIIRLKPDVLHITSFFEGFGDNAVHSIRRYESCPSGFFIAVTFYDVIPMIQKEIYLDPNPHFKKPYFEKIEQLKRADLLLSISDSSRREVIDHLGFHPENVVNISAAVDDSFRPFNFTKEDALKFKADLGIRDRFIMYSGATDDRKNHVGLISAYAMLSERMRETYQLVLIGGMPIDHRHYFESHIKKCGLSEDDVIIVGRVSDENMVRAYSICDLYVFPSWHEGFGLPALEAMSCGAPVIGSNTTSVPEVIGFERALFDPHSPRAIADKIQEALGDPVFLAELKKHACVQAAKFSWDESAKRAIQAFEKLFSNEKSDKPDGAEERKAEGGNLIASISSIIAKNRTGIDLRGLAQSMAMNVRGGRRQLLVDVSELVQRDSRSGIQRVVRSILQEWLNHPPRQFDLRLVYANNLRAGYRYANRFTQLFFDKNDACNKVVGENEDFPIDFGNGDVFIALDLQHEVQIFQASFYQHMRAYGVDVRFVVYDLLPVTMPECFSAAASANHALWLTEVAKADEAICISKSVAKDFNIWLDERGIEASRRPNISWFHLGADIESSAPTFGLPADSQFLLEQIGVAPSFLMVGTLEPRKGHAQVLEAFSKLWESKIICNLVFVGRTGWSVDGLLGVLRTHPKLNSRLFWIEGASDEYLEKIYAASTCLIAASYGEGFGLPLIEAAQHKLPIMARDIPVFREVAGEHAFYFDGLEPQDLAGAIERWLALYASGQHPRSDAMPWLTWAQSAQQLLQRILPASAQPSSQPLQNTSQIGL